jgi:hypothetical protein
MRGRPDDGDAPVHQPHGLVGVNRVSLYGKQKR